ncbi:hypothetical protein HAX54_009002 [Datura stramonium]|uniref:FAF domain-containing protein n=1 Tax=Datura stramonium TaxID=4076 RepID=A0ABS8X009_DATST|nr:hypothetical protein [Datura stramonium]
MAAACGSLQHIFDNPLPETPSSLIETISSSWNQSTSLKTIDDSSFTEIFGELHFKENNSVSSSSSSSCGLSSSSFSSCVPLSSASSSYSSSSSSFFLDAIHQSEIERLENNNNKDKYESNKSPVSSYSQITSNNTNISHKNNKQDRHSDSFSSKASDSLSMCTEGLGFESSDDVEDLINDLSNEDHHHQQQQQHQQQRQQEEQQHQQQKQQEEREQGRKTTRISCRIENRVIFNQDYNLKRSRTKNRSSFPPPISCIGRSGKPWVCFKSFREDGRFILKEIRIPTQEFLHACREDGRLMMHVIQSDDEIVDEDEDEDEIYDDDDDDDSYNVEEGHDNNHDAKHV